MKRKQLSLIFIITLLLSIVPLFACSSKKENSSSNTFMQIKSDEAKKMMDSMDKYIILDVRTEDEYNEFHIENAINIPDYEIGTKAEDILKDKNQTIFVYCRSGRRSKGAAKELVTLGYTNVIDFGGVIDWHYGFVSQ